MNNNAIIPRTIPSWNLLLAMTVEATSVDEFKRRLSPLRLNGPPTSAGYPIWEFASQNIYQNHNNA